MLLAFFFTNLLLFAPPPDRYKEKDLPNLIYFSTGKGEKIAAWWQPPGEGRPTILYAHGNAEDLEGSVDLYTKWGALGYGVLAYDYPGYGLSTGKASVDGCERAAQAAWGYLQEQGIGAESLVLVGRSVGSGPSTWLAEQIKPAGLVLISPFKSVYSVPFRVGILPWDHFRNLRRIRSMTTPLLVIHGEKDSLISPSHGKAIEQASASADKTFLPVPGAGHNNLFLVGQKDIMRAISEFCDRVTKPHDQTE